MCKALSHDIVIEPVRLLARRGGKRDFQRRSKERKDDERSHALLHGLVLAGGRSSRMQRDKAALEYRAARRSSTRAMKLLERRVARAFVSVRADQQRRSRARAVTRRSSIAATSKAHRRHQRRAGAASRCRLAGARLRPAVPRRAHARHAARSRATPASRHRLPLQSRRVARAAVRDLRAASARKRSPRRSPPAGTARANS